MVVEVKEVLEFCVALLLVIECSSGIVKWSREMVLMEMAGLTRLVVEGKIVEWDVAAVVAKETVFGVAM